MILLVSLAALLLSGCAIPNRQYYTLNYVSSPIQNRRFEEPYPFVIRIKEFSIEEAYNRNQIVYRLNPFQLQYYVYRHWAVRPTRMITDLIDKHLVSSNLVSATVRRFDEGRTPDYQLSGSIEALEEYDSEDLTFAHMAMRIYLSRISDGRTIYSRRFSLRRRVYQQEAEFVIRELSNILEYIMTMALEDIDAQLAEEFGIISAGETDIAQPDNSITGSD